MVKPPVRGKTSPYGFFVKMCYEEHKKKYPNENVQVTEISKKCSEKWKTMTEDEKRRFVELAQKDAERYQQEMEQYGGEDAFRKRRKIKKDPNAPKRALSAFFFFSQVKRGEITAEHPDWKVGQVAQELGKLWKMMSEEEKKTYEQMAINDKARYENDMAHFKAGTYSKADTSAHDPTFNANNHHAAVQQRQQQQQMPVAAASTSNCVLPQQIMQNAAGVQLPSNVMLQGAQQIQMDASLVAQLQQQQQQQQQLLLQQQQQQLQQQQPTPAAGTEPTGAGQQQLVSNNTGGQSDESSGTATTAAAAAAAVPEPASVAS